jgi:hypothetical protein
MDPVGLFGFCNIYSVYMCQSVVNDDTVHRRNRTT